MNERIRIFVQKIQKSIKNSAFYRKFLIIRGLVLNFLKKIGNRVFEFLAFIGVIKVLKEVFNAIVKVLMFLCIKNPDVIDEDGSEKKFSKDLVSKNSLSGFFNFFFFFY